MIPAADREAHLRLIRHLRRELGRRRALSAAEPRNLIDGVGAFLAEHEGIESAEIAEAFRRVFSDGPEVGILFVVAGELARASSAATVSAVPWPENAVLAG